MLSDALLKATKEVMRRSQSGPTSQRDLAERLCMLLRVTAITTTDRRAAVTQVRDELKPYIPELHVLESLTARVLELLDADDLTRSAIEPELDALLDEVREAETELAEQTAVLLAPGDGAVVLGEAAGGYIEAGLRDAGESAAEGNPPGEPIRVTVVRVAPDHAGVADGMAGRLADAAGLSVCVVQDAAVAGALGAGRVKVLLGGAAVDADEGALCGCGAGSVCAAANRMRVPVVVVAARHRFVPVGAAVVGVLGMEKGAPGMVWAYEEARAERGCEAIAVLAARWDVVALQKVDLVVTEYGGYAPEYVKSLAPNVEGEGSGEMPA